MGHSAQYCGQPLAKACPAWVSTLIHSGAASSYIQQVCDSCNPCQARLVAKSCPFESRIATLLAVLHIKQVAGCKCEAMQEALHQLRSSTTALAEIQRGMP